MGYMFSEVTHSKQLNNFAFVETKMGGLWKGAMLRLTVAAF